MIADGYNLMYWDNEVSLVGSLIEQHAKRVVEDFDQKLKLFVIEKLNQLGHFFDNESDFFSFAMGSF